MNGKSVIKKERIMKIRKSEQTTNDYPYTKRMSELERIGSIPYRGVKLGALQRFIQRERHMLAHRENPLIRSQALDAASRTRARIEQEIRWEKEGKPALGCLSFGARVAEAHPAPGALQSWSTFFLQRLNRPALSGVPVCDQASSQDAVPP